MPSRPRSPQEPSRNIPQGWLDHYRAGWSLQLVTGSDGTWLDMIGADIEPAIEPRHLERIYCIGRKNKVTWASQNSCGGKAVHHLLAAGAAATFAA
jgi:hypothetical protein